MIRLNCQVSRLVSYLGAYSSMGLWATALLFVLVEPGSTDIAAVPEALHRAAG
jgi:hypothetical protein